ncbi:MAG TPA: GNAT family N-acetyltransferase [Lactovum miscens]|uniref:GNAT family N-acetyltransferase n=1 Tax=Lactovum miscens TaxID=190387 RepID=UPI002EDB908C
MYELKQFTNDSKDLSDFYALYLYCFKGSDSPERRAYFNYRYEHSLKYGIKQDDQLKSGLLSIPLEVNFHDVLYKMNGICDVASYPEFGGQGGITDIMKLVLQDMYDNHTALSYLSPFSYEFYLRFGYEEVFDHCYYQVESNNLPKIKIDSGAGYVERYDFKDVVPLIKELYNKDLKNHSGGLDRSDWWWNYLTMKRSNWETALYFDKNNDIKGYLIYIVNGSDKNQSTFSIQDFSYNDLNSYQHLLKFVCQHQSMYQIFEYNSSYPTAYLDVLKEPTAIKATIRPYMMARIVNLKEFISNYPFLKDFENIKLSVDDKILSENKGVWNLSVKEGTVIFEKVSDKDQDDADIRFSIQSLTKSFLGYRSLTHLFKIEGLCGNQDAMIKLSESLIKETPLIQDYF